MGGTVSPLPIGRGYTVLWWVHPPLECCCVGWRKPLYQPTPVLVGNASRDGVAPPYREGLRSTVVGTPTTGKSTAPVKIIENDIMVFNDRVISLFRFNFNNTVRLV